MKNEKCAVVVMSCDSHEDVSSVYSRAFRKFWPDCPFELVLVNECVDQGEGFDRVVAPGKREWSERLAQTLESLRVPYVILMCDDYLVCRLVNTQNILSRLSDAERLDVLNLRLANSPATKRYLRPCGEHGLKTYPKSRPYCIATQPGIWNRDCLLRLARAARSAWDFERNGTRLAASDPRPVLATAACEFDHIDAVRRGLWHGSALDFCLQNGIPLDLSRRGVQSAATRLLWLVRDVVYGLAPRFFTAVSLWWSRMRT